MSSIDESTAPIFKYITGQSQDICRLCFRESAQVDYLDQLCNIESNDFIGVVSFQDIFKELEVSTDSALPNKLCEECADLSIKAFMFRQLCQHSQSRWVENVERLERCIKQNIINSFNPNTNTAFLIIQNDKDFILTSRKTQKDKTKEAVIGKIKYLLTQEKRKKIESQKREAKSKKYSCPYCNKLLLTKKTLELHKERIHEPKTLECSECSKKFSSEHTLKIHQSAFHKPGVCRHCHIIFEDQKELRQHMSQHELAICPQCNKQLKNKFILKSHMQICGGQKQNVTNVYCDICNKSYQRKNSLRSHLIMEHGFGKTYPCPWCDKKYDAISKLKHHEVKHTRERKFSCEICGDLFVSKAALTFHTRIHTGEKPYPCDLCDEHFLSPSRRMEHKRRKHFKPSHQCSMCDSKFITRYTLRVHEARHNNPRSTLYLADNDRQKKKIKPNTVPKIIYILPEQIIEQ